MMHVSASRVLVLLTSFILTSRELLFGIYHAAKCGRILPRLTLLLLFHIAIHSTVVGQRWYRTSRFLLWSNTILNVVGYVFLVLLYRHSVKVIFNRKIPTFGDCVQPRAHPAIQSFNTHLLMLRPLEILFRFLTSPFRVLPDVIVLGEVRCGTTTLCSQLASLSGKKAKIKCYTPFCPWAHPELDNKESFYFVGHYLGIVDPYFYRMAFPLIITRWWEEHVLGNIFLTFDGSAQYLSSPTAPYLIAGAYTGNAPPVLVACIRNPVEQAISWWQYENNAMTWGESMGLSEWNSDLRSRRYPPKTILEALEYSKSSIVRQAYKDAESLVKTTIDLKCLSWGQNKFQAGNDEKNLSIKESKCWVTGLIQRLSNLSHNHVLTLPSWAITWPCGQLSVIGQGYSRNLKRYNEVFQSAFSLSDEGDEMGYQKTKNRIGCVHIVPLESQTNMIELKSLLRPILADLVHICADRTNQPISSLNYRMELALDRVCADSADGAWRNSNPPTIDEAVRPTPFTNVHVTLRNHFEAETTEMEFMLRRPLMWR